MSNVLVRGTDGAIPKYDPEGLFKEWEWDEVYFGQEAAGKHAVKVKDKVYRVSENKTWIVTNLDLTTLIPTLAPLGEAEQTLTSQVLIGDGLQPVTFTLYYDNSKVPFTASIDSRHYINGSANTYARIFKGTNIGPSGRVISAVFNGSNYVDDKIPLELIVYDDHTNLARKSVPSFSTTEILADGEVCTVVIYNSQNVVTHKKTLVVEKTSFIRPVNEQQKYIVGITLKSSFLNSNDPYVIDYPLNVPIGSLNVKGIVHYSNGSSIELDIDDVKFRLEGLEAFVATRPGQRIPLMLVYNLEPNEAVYGAVSADGKKITEPYFIVTTFENGAFSPVLFGYPLWDKIQAKYNMRWWLMDLSRSVLFDATSQVIYNASSDIFDGNNYNSIQKLSIRVNLSNVSAALPDWLHTQTLYVKLNNPNITNKLIPSFEVSQENVDGSFYGSSLTARTTVVDQNNYQVSIQNNRLTLDSWINDLYFKTNPVYSLYKESKAPTPNQFSIINDLNNIQTFPITSWNQTLHIFSDLSQTTNLVVRWERKLNDSSVLQLAVSEIPLQVLN